MTMNTGYGFEVIEEIEPVYEGDFSALEADVKPERRVYEGVVTPEVVTPMDSVYMTINKYRRIHPKYMEMVTGLDFNTLKDILGGEVIFQDPALFHEEDEYDSRKGWVLRVQYLSGNVASRYEEAKEAEERFPGKFKANIRALEAVLHSYVPFDNIYVSLGAPWCPEWIFESFLNTLFSCRDHIRVHYMKSISKWEVKFDGRAKRSILNKRVYGLDTYMTAQKIIEKVMNGSAIKVYKTVTRDGKESRVADAALTKAAQEKEEVILSEFSQWIRNAPAKIRDAVEQAYNDTFGGIGSWNYDCTFIDSFPDLNPEVDLYPHQRNAIGRILLSGRNTLLCHEVGSGKTYTFVAAVHEMKRIGLSKKNLIVVPNNVLSATIETHHYLYPEDQLLEIYPSDFTPAKRKQSLKKIRDEDYSAAYIAFSSFDMIRVSDDFEIQRKKAEISRLRAASMVNRRERELIESRISRINKVIQKILGKGVLEDTIYFEDLGIDCLVIDEAHNYKNISVESADHEFISFQKKGSKKSDSMLMKTKAVKRVIFSTGTPVTNSLADIYVMQQYLQEEDLRSRGIGSFDKWAKTFAEGQNVIEIDVDGSGLRTRKRFSYFHNLPELMSIFSGVCDYYDSGNAREGCPDFDGYDDIVVEKTKGQDRYFKKLSQRASLIRRGRVSKKDDNLLKISSDGNCASLDPRIKGKPYGGRKISACASEVVDIYMAYPGKAQVVFCDVGTPKEGFNAYDELKEILVAYGIPAEEIAYVHDAKTAAAQSKLFDSVNKGRIRVIIGSTSKLGQGVNIQDNLVCAHHLSIPFRPADLIQRDGRIWRRGNRCRRIQVKRYVTKGTYDSYSYQILENKARVLSQFLAGTCTARTLEDLSETMLSYAEIKALALGDPRIRQRVELANRLEKVRMSCRQRQIEINDIRERFVQLPKEILALSDLVEASRRDYQIYKDTRKPLTKAEREMIGKSILFVLHKNYYQEKPRKYGEYQGFEVFIPERMTRDEPYVSISSKTGENSYRVVLADASAPGVCKRLDHALSHLNERADRLEERKQELLDQAVLMRKELDAGNPYDGEIENLKTKLDELDAQIGRV